MNVIIVITVGKEETPKKVNPRYTQKQPYLDDLGGLGS